MGLTKKTGFNEVAQGNVAQKLESHGDDLTTELSVWVRVTNGKTVDKDMHPV